MVIFREDEGEMIYNSNSFSAFAFAISYLNYAHVDHFSLLASGSSQS